MGNKIKLISIILLLFAVVKTSAQCDQWKITATPQTSICAANGRITTAATGVGSVTGILYSLEPVISGGYGVSPNTSSVFENVPAGSYKVVAQGICNNASVSVFTNVVVPGNYIPFTATVVQKRTTLNNCNTGQANVLLSNGKGPYTITITNKPAAYIGRTSFTSGYDFVIDSLRGGSYTLSITDACGARANTQTLSITELPLMTSNDFFTYSLSQPGDNCNQFIVRSPEASSGSPFVDYTGGEKPILYYSVSYDGGPKAPYKPANSDNADTITLPSEQRFKDTYDKYITYYLRSSCQLYYRLQ
jgi:hypothetical protein